MGAAPATPSPGAAPAPAANVTGSSPFATATVICVRPASTGTPPAGSNAPGAARRLGWCSANRAMPYVRPARRSRHTPAAAVDERVRRLTHGHQTARSVRIATTSRRRPNASPATRSPPRSRDARTPAPGCARPAGPLTQSCVRAAASCVLSRRHLLVSPYVARAAPRLVPVAPASSVVSASPCTPT